MSNAFSLTKLARLFNVGNAGCGLGLDVSGNPTVMAAPIGRNVIVNGGCEVSQHNYSTLITSIIWLIQLITSSLVRHKYRNYKLNKYPTY